MKSGKYTCRIFWLIIVLWFQTMSLAAQMPAVASDTAGVIPVFAELLLGGWHNGEWLAAETVAGMFPAAMKFRVYSFDKQLADVVGSAPDLETDPEESRGIVFGGGSADDSVDENAEVTLKIGGEKSGMPRRPLLQTGGLQVYEKLVAEYLKKNGVAARPVIQQLVRVDLDGDGSGEVIIVAGNADATVSVIVRNTYSLVLLRRLVKGKAVDSVIRAHYYHEDVEGMADSPSSYRVAFVVDINGDGVLEVLIRGRYYEGFWYEIHEFRNNELIKVLSEGLGA